LKGAPENRLTAGVIPRTEKGALVFPKHVQRARTWRNGQKASAPFEPRGGKKKKKKSPDGKKGGPFNRGKGPVFQRLGQACPQNLELKEKKPKPVYQKRNKKKVLRTSDEKRGVPFSSIKRKKGRQKQWVLDAKVQGWGWGEKKNL